MATTTKAQPATGRRVALTFGTKKIKRKGKDVTISLVSKISQSTITALAIKLKPAIEKPQEAKLVKDKKGRLYLPSSGGTNSARRSMLISADGIKFYNVIIPTNCSYGLAKTVLAKNSKAIVFKTPAGRTQLLGDGKKLKPKPKPTGKPAAK